MSHELSQFMREKMTSRKEEKQWSRSSSARIVMLAVALAMFGFFVFLQEMTIDNSNFLFLMFFSFVFPAVGIFLILKAFARSSGVEKKLCLVVAVISIIALLFVANSLMRVPRGGFYNTTDVTPSSFTLPAERNWDGSYSGEYSQIIYTARYSEASVRVSVEGLSFDVISIRPQKVVRMNATLYVFMMLKPHEVAGHSVFSESIAFNESRTTEYMEPDILMVWGKVDPAYRTRLDGYDLELMMRLHGVGSDVGPSLDFTVDMSNFRLSIHDYVVDSELQNGLSITLTGIFMGIILYIPGKFLNDFQSRKTSLSLIYLLGSNKFSAGPRLTDWSQHRAKGHRTHRFCTRT